MRRADRSEWEILNTRRQALSKTDPVVKYNEYQTYPKEKKFAIIKAWEKYYEDVRKSPAYENFMEQRQAYKRFMLAHSNDEKAKYLQEVKERARWARELREQGGDIPKPSFPYDPLIFFSIGEISEYLKVTRKMNETTNSTGVDF